MYMLWTIIQGLMDIVMDLLLNSGYMVAVG